jgi:hypothetical protein
VADGLKLIARDDEKDLGQIVHPFLVCVHNGGSGWTSLTTDGSYEDGSGIKARHDVPRGSAGITDWNDM